MGFIVVTYTRGLRQGSRYYETTPDQKTILATCDAYLQVDLTTGQREIHIKLLYGTCLDLARFTQNYNVLVKPLEGCSFRRKGEPVKMVQGSLTASYDTNVFGPGHTIVNIL